MSSESPSIDSPHVELYEIIQQDCEFEEKAEAALELGGNAISELITLTSHGLTKRQISGKPSLALIPQTGSFQLV